MRQFYFVLFFLISLIACDSKKDAGFIHAGNLRIYYERQGTGPAVLMLYAGLQDHRMWNDQVDKLKKRFQVITIDLPGQGNTSGNDTTILIADVLVNVLDSLHVPSTSLIGLSYGSSCATDFLLAYPERVNKVVLASPGLTGWKKVLQPDSVTRRYFALMDSTFSKKDHNKTADLFTEVWGTGPFRTPEQVDSKVLEYIHTSTFKNLQQHEKDSWANFSTITAAESLQEIRTPILIVYGNKDIPFIVAVSHFLKHSIKGSKEIEIRGVAHMLNMEATDEFNSIVTTFLE